MDSSPPVSAVGAGAASAGVSSPVSFRWTRDGQLYVALSVCKGSDVLLSGHLVPEVRAASALKGRKTNSQVPIEDICVLKRELCDRLELHVQEDADLSAVYTLKDMERKLQVSVFSGSPSKHVMILQPRAACPQPSQALARAAEVANREEAPALSRLLSSVLEAVKGQDVERDVRSFITYLTVSQPKFCQPCFSEFELEP